MDRSFELDLDESELVLIGIDDIVLDAGWSGISLAKPQCGLHVAVRRFGQELSCAQADYDVVVSVAMPARFCTGLQAPLGDDDALGLLEQFAAGAWSWTVHRMASRCWMSRPALLARDAGVLDHHRNLGEVHRRHDVGAGDAGNAGRS